MAIWKRTDNWLAGIAQADHPNHTITEIADLTPETAQAAFDASYGAGRFKVTGHGSVITVWSNDGYAAQLRRYAANARERGDMEHACKMEAKAAAVAVPGWRPQ